MNHLQLASLALGVASLVLASCASTTSTGANAGGSDVRAINAALDAFHEAASKAEGERYFNLLTDDAVFIGTDDTERWSKAQFKAYAEPYFSKGKGWTYTPHDRFVEVASDGRTAWFDEKLDNEKYGRCRGSGVLRKEAGAWRIAQYVLSVPVPNELMPQVAEMIRNQKPASRP